MTYIIHYKEFGNDWKKTSYTCPEQRTEQFLIDFFGLDECEDFKIEVSNN